MADPEINLRDLFAAVAQVLDERREALNLADEYNHNHGDHMLEIFQVAAQAADETQSASMEDAMDVAAEMLRQRAENGSAQVYGRGLSLLAGHFRQRGVSLGDLLAAVQSYLKEGKKAAGEDDSLRSSDVLKAMLAALAEWERVEMVQKESAPEKTGASKPASGLDMGYLFSVGMAYMQAKQKGGDKLETLSETVVSASPLGSVPYRHQSGVIAVRALLEAMYSA